MQKPTREEYIKLEEYLARYMVGATFEKDGFEITRPSQIANFINYVKPFSFREELIFTANHIKAALMRVKESDKKPVEEIAETLNAKMEAQTPEATISSDSSALHNTLNSIAISVSRIAIILEKVFSIKQESCDNSTKQEFPSQRFEASESPCGSQTTVKAEQNKPREQKLYDLSNQVTKDHIVRTLSLSEAGRRLGSEFSRMLATEVLNKLDNKEFPAINKLEALKHYSLSRSEILGIAGKISRFSKTYYPDMSLQACRNRARPTYSLNKDQIVSIIRRKFDYISDTYPGLATIHASVLETIAKKIVAREPFSQKDIPLNLPKGQKQGIILQIVREVNKFEKFNNKHNNAR